MPPQRPPRVLLAKVGLDGHDRGVRILSRALRDEGMEIIYLGLRRTPEQVVAAAKQEDVNVIGLSSLSGEHNTLFPEVVKLAKSEGLDDVLIIGGGVIPKVDAQFLKDSGVSAVFGPDTYISEIASYIRNNVRP